MADHPNNPGAREPATKPELDDDLSDHAEDLTAASVSGGAWRAASTFGGAALQFAVSIVLARLLTPADFGTVTLVAVVVGIANMLAFLGVGPALVRRKTLTPDYVATAWTLSVIGMNATQRGIYISLLAYQWANGHAPAMREQCARIAGAEQMQDADWDAVRAKFALVDSDRMVNARLEECRGICKSRSDNAKRAAAASWQKRAQSASNAGADAPADADADATAMRPHMREQSASNASHSHSQIPIPPKAPPSKGGQRLRRRDLDKAAADPNWIPF